MKTKNGFNLRKVCGESILVAEGEENIDFSNIISMNDSATFLWTKAQEVENFTEEDLLAWLTSEYDVEEEVARKDVNTLVQQWQEAGIIQ